MAAGLPRLDQRRKIQEIKKTIPLSQRAEQYNLVYGREGKINRWDSGESIEGFLRYALCVSAPLLVSGRLTNLIPLELVIKGGAADPQMLGRLFLDPAALLQGFQQQIPFML